MFILATNLYRTPIVASGAGKVGELGEPIINPENGQLLAFHVLPASLFGSPKIITLIDIVVLDPKIVIINNPDSIIESKEVVRIQESIEKKVTFLKAKAYTQNNTYLGKVEDAVIDTDANMIVKYYIKNFLQNRILPAEKVIEIKRNKIIFDDSVIKPNFKSAGMII